MNAKTQLEKKITPNPGTFYQFQTPIIFDVINSKQFVPLNANEIMSLINRHLIFGSSEFVEHPEGECSRF